MAPYSSVILLASLFAMMPTRSNAHGYLKVPASRNYIANSDYCPQCLSMGGPGTVSAGGKNWPDGNRGICGDPYTDPQPRKHEANGIYYGGVKTPAGNELVAGSVAKFTFVLTAFHKGRFGLRICKINGGTADDEKAQLTEDCLDKNILLQANVAQAQAPGDRYYHLGTTPSANGIYEAYYQIPSNLTCNGVTSRCVLQWFYLTGNSCNPPNEPAQYTTPNLGTCGNGAYPEEFANCATVSVTGGSSSPTISPPPFPSPSPVPSPSRPPPSPVTIPPPIPSPVTIPPPIPSPVTIPPPIPSPPSPASPSSPSSSPAAFCASIGKYGFFADRTSGCVNFYRCETSGSWQFTCPTGLKFNEKASACDFPFNVAC